MAEKEKIIKILYESISKPDKQIWLMFPLWSVEEAWGMLGQTEGYATENNIPFRIAKVESPIWNLKQYLHADAPLQKISLLAEKIGEMGKEEREKFSGILDCCSISSMDDVLRAADSLGMYEYLPGITCSRQLGGYLVENGIMEFPKVVWKYLDYAGIGEEYYAEHSCAFTRFGLVVRREDMGLEEKMYQRMQL